MLGLKDTAAVGTENHPPPSWRLPCDGGVRESALKASLSIHTRGDQGYGDGVIAHPEWMEQVDERAVDQGLTGSQKLLST